MATALLMSGCGSGGGSGEPEPKPSSEQTAEPTGDPGGEAATGGVNGTWSAEGDGKAMVLSISGDQAALLGETTCTGTADTGADPVTFALKCTDGSTDRTRGTVKSVEGESLTVAWESGTTDTFTKVEVPEVSTEIPEIGDLPSGLPSDLDLPTE
ncbi:hypothetical protein IQ279_14640 [Streptomyces verrucosisporus]|uniref:hypothetical protein n=1 Tax=Streptomyces verrucosisporus TaxID=1695161 RepID=UPI0019D02F8D|nr:hypothetical protein [Streptomyces verrucosisporus]MBN3930853.1 hypothetical protein [Streptomyces verrucosisporus]